jgi:hypothetical protein
MSIQKWILEASEHPTAHERQVSLGYIQNQMGGQINVLATALLQHVARLRYTEICRRRWNRSQAWTGVDIECKQTKTEGSEIKVGCGLGIYGL